MCGIVAFSSKHEPALEPLLGGLRRLEYRGYDSAGVALLGADSIYVQKAVGKIHELEAVIAEHPAPFTTTVGIAHTRWATHGAATKRNAHPHQDASGKIWVTHNGIIENYELLKEKLEADGMVFSSETDTEVIAKLIGAFYEGDLREAVLQAAKLLVGAFSICVVCADEPGRLIGVKVASPLVAGIGRDEIIIASDVSAIIERTKKVIYLEDGELIDVRGNDYEIVSLDNKPTVKTIATIDWDFETATKGGYEHFLLKEIMEQPRVIEDSIRGRLIESAGDFRFGGLIDIEKRLRHVRNVVLLGVGTSYYAAKLGELYFNAVAGVPAVAAMSPEYRYTKNVIDKHTWLIAVSQSGETADTIAAIEEAKRHGALVTGVVNVVGSTIARMTDGGVYNHIGPEISVASTKAFTSQSLLLLMHACLLGRRNDLDYSEAAELIKAIKRLPRTIQKVLDERAQIEAVAKQLAHCRNLLYIGRQYNYPIALEGALKIKEIAYVHAEGLSAGELKHGFIALVDEHLPTIALATEDSVTDKMLANIAEVRSRGGKVFTFANKSRGDKDAVILPSVGSDLLQPLVNNVALQLLAYYVAKQKDVDIDQPRNLAKSVTVE
ncbi:MAG TPA: glutamine--fructose-6-phosphate transaminase (isomerizing) [Candidatus Saccharimonadales bacterium]|nr:glutamine--fructose-6-phosphate transaminase (isomerizing) [Candidatus Saccharimonadales bacterium]